MPETAAVLLPFSVWSCAEKKYPAGYWIKSQTRTRFLFKTQFSSWISHLTNLQLEKKIDYIRHAKISPNKQFLLSLLLKKPHRWFAVGCPLLKLLCFADVQSRDMSNENRLTFPTQCLYLKFPFSLMRKPALSKKIKFPIPVSKHIGPNNSHTPFSHIPLLRVMASL